MATKRFLALQANRTEIHTITVTAVAVGGIIGISINSKIVQYVCVTGDTTSTAATGLANALRASTDPEFTQFSVAVDSTTTTQINVTASNPGVFISADGNTAFTEVESGGATITAAVLQQGKSPRDAGDTVNWSGGALPANSGDTVYFEDSLFPAWYRANSSFTGKTFDALYVRPEYVGAGIGMPKFNPSGYQEYISGRLTMTGCSVLDVTIPDQAGFEAFRFDVGAVVCAAIVRGNNAGTIGQEAVEWIGTHANNTFQVYGGSARICPYVGDVATVLTLKVIGGVCSVGSGGTLTTVEAEDGGIDLRCGCTTLTVSGDSGTSQVTLRDAAAVTTINLRSGSVFHNSSGNIETLTLGPGASIDFSGSDQPITITNAVSMAIGSRFWDPNGRVTLSAGWTTVQCSQSDVTTNFGKNRTYTVT